MAKASIHFATDSEVVTHLGACVVRANLEGIDLTRQGRLSKSRVIRTAIRFGYEASVERMREPAPVALPQTTVTTDADRLKAAMSRQGLTNSTLGAAIGVSRDVVKNAVRGLAMGPALRAWLAEQEASDNGDR